MKKKRVYMDYAAATPVDNKVLAAMRPYFGAVFGNPSALHQEGVAAKRALEGARASIAKVLRVRPYEIIFTGGATESINLAIRGAVAAFRKTSDETPEIVTSAIEHPAVLETVRALEREGARAVFLKPDARGLIDPGLVSKALTRRTAVVSIGYVNSEIGVIQDIRAMGRAVFEFRRAHGSAYPLFHTDAVQAPNYLDSGAERLGVDLLTLSAGKIYGPKGIGLLFRKRTARLEPLHTGGGQEWGLRSGTEAVPLTVGFAAALELASALREKESKRLAPLRDRLMDGLLALPGVSLNGDRKRRVSNNVNISIEGIDNEFFAVKLDQKGVAVSTKSACAEGGAASHVILALEGDTERARTALRFTLGRATRKHDIAAALAAVRAIMSPRIANR